jgi:hypothetical protein
MRVPSAHTSDTGALLTFAAPSEPLVSISPQFSADRPLVRSLQKQRERRIRVENPPASGLRPIHDRDSVGCVAEYLNQQFCVHGVHWRGRIVRHRAAIPAHRGNG